MTIVAGPSSAPVRREASSPRTAVLADAVVQALAYGDLFEWPLTIAELHRWLPVAAELGEVESVLRWAPLSALLTVRDGLVSLAGREWLMADRRTREARSAELWPRAISYASVIASLPFVRMVAITGSLAISAARSEADVDLLIVTEDRRLWLSRAMTTGVVRAARRRGLQLCPNYVIDESSLELRERDLFTAHELVQMVPIAGSSTLDDLVASNGWYRDFLPNHPGPAGPVRGGGGAGFRAAAEWIGRSPLLDRLERWEMDRKIGRLTRAAPTGAAGRLGASETRYDEHTCKGHVDGYRGRTLAALDERLAGLRGIEP